MDDIFDDVRELYDEYGFFDKPFTHQNLKFRHSLLVEEYYETQRAFESGDAEEFVDGLIDLIVIAAGTLELAGVDGKTAWLEVLRANSEKKVGVKKGREQSKGFDLTKPKGWKAPDHTNNHGKLDEII